MNELDVQTLEFDLNSEQEQKTQHIVNLEAAGQAKDLKIKDTELNNRKNI